jgi:N-acetylmuramoyl-L-alanine amidase
MQIPSRYKYNLFFFLVFLSINAFSQNNSKFTIVLDAGHGGKDFGTIHHGFVEKKIALNVTLKVGKLLEKYPDIIIVYTRKTDVFIELKERANISNKVDADLFVSIHCNGVKNQEPFGTETFVMGLTRNATNLEVAKKENSVITLETDYKVKYAGFDPNNPQSLVGLKILQEENLEQSITLASKIQDNFTNNLNRKNRGVKQAPIWVLDATVMPGVLVELGFLSNKNEGEYVNSEKGQDELAKAIADGILKYKKEFYGVFNGSGTVDKNEHEVKDEPKKTVAVEKSKTVDSTKNVVKTTKPVVSSESVSPKGVIFKIQIASGGTKLETVPSNFKGLDPISIIEDNGMYKYYYGNFANYDLAKQQLQEAKAKGYNSAFIVAYIDGKKVSVQEALKVN